MPERSFPSSREAALDAVSVGAAFGETVAQAVLADRANDGAFAEPPFTEVPAPQDFRDHRPDPTVGPEPQQNYAAHWATVDAFGFTDILNPDAGGPARLPPPLAAGYQDGIEQVLRVGARDAEATGDRTAEQTEVGIFWAYDGAFGIGVPPRLYNDAVDGLIATGSPRAITRDPFRLVRLYAVVNVALADAGVVAWREKVRRRPDALRAPVRAHWRCWRRSRVDLIARCVCSMRSTFGVPPLASATRRATSRAA